MKGLFINCIPGQCSIYESGLDVYTILNQKFDIDYTQTRNPGYVGIYDYAIVNYNLQINRGLTKKTLQIKTIGLNFEMMPNNPFSAGPDEFDALCIPDPTMNYFRADVFSFPRPIINYFPQRIKSAIPVIGFHGFVTAGKPIEPIVNAINKEFDVAKVKLHCPFATHVPNSHITTVDYCNCLKSLLKPSIQVEIEHNYFSKIELINWVATCDLMVYHYYRNMSGLAATIDQCICAGTPVSVSDCSTFRHVHAYSGAYPKVPLIDAMNNLDSVKKMREDWSEVKFQQRFEQVLNFLQHC